MKIETVVPLPPEDSGLQHCIAGSITATWIPSEKTRPVFQEGAGYDRKPRDQSKGSPVCDGQPRNLSITKLAVALDYDAVDALGVRFKDTVNLEVRRAGRWEVWQWFWNHPDQSVQLSIKLGVVGAVLGVMGFLTGVAPYLLG